jgi:hypothetical protein
MTRWNENQILELLESMNKTSDKIIEILNRIEEKLEKKYLKNESKPIVSRPPFYYQRKKDK